MSLLRKVTAKPWEHAGEMEGLHGGYAGGQAAGKTGLYMFLAVISSFFILFSISYQMRATYADWEAVAEPGILWFNSGILVLASAALQLASAAVRRGSMKSSRNYLAVGTVLTLVFLAGQLLAWRQMINAGLYAYNNPANAFFYVFTGLHALHLLGGLWFLGDALKKAISNGDDPALPLRVQLCTSYWHFLLLVWAVLFYLLLNS